METPQTPIDPQSQTQPLPQYTTEISDSSRTQKILRVVGGIIAIGFVIYTQIDNQAVKTNNDAISNYNSGNREEAIDQFKNAINSAVSDETKINALINLGYTYATDYQNEEALDAFKQANALTTANSYEQHLTAGEIALLEKNASLAEQEYKAAYALRPNDAQINNALGLFYLDYDEIAPDFADAKKAIPYLEKAFEENPEEYVRLNLGLAYFADENFTKTTEILTKSDFDKEPYSAFWLGLSYLQLEDEANARRYLQQAKDKGVVLPAEMDEFLSTPTQSDEAART